MNMCCHLHGPTCEPPSELCCHECTEVAHGLDFFSGHVDGTKCVLERPSEAPDPADPLDRYAHALGRIEVILASTHRTFAQRVEDAQEVIDELNAEREQLLAQLKAKMDD